MAMCSAIIFSHTFARSEHRDVIHMILYSTDDERDMYEENKTRRMHNINYRSGGFTVRANGALLWKLIFVILMIVKE